jgi:hypothetical protein
LALTSTLGALPDLLMNFLRMYLIGVFLCLALMPVAKATTFSTSSTTSLVSESVGSASNSLRGSSNSSSGGNNVAAGDYKILGITAVANQPGWVVLTLQALAPKGEQTELELFLPQAVVTRAELSSGRVITARDRPYGLAFSVAGQSQAFYLMLHDEWYRDLFNHAVTL